MSASTKASAPSSRVQPRSPHPVGSVNGGQGVQVCHGELQAALPQVVVHVHHTTQRGGAAEGVGPRLQGGHGSNAWWERSAAEPKQS